MPVDELCKRRPDDASPRRTGLLMEHMIFDMAKAEEVLGYRSMEQGLEKSLRWCMDAGLV